MVFSPHVNSRGSPRSRLHSANYPGLSRDALRLGQTSRARDQSYFHPLRLAANFPLDRRFHADSPAKRAGEHMDPSRSKSWSEIWRPPRGRATCPVERSGFGHQLTLGLPWLSYRRKRKDSLVAFVFFLTLLFSCPLSTLLM
jgi:hypothetical protein